LRPELRLPAMSRRLSGAGTTGHRDALPTAEIVSIADQFN